MLDAAYLDAVSSPFLPSQEWTSSLNYLWSITWITSMDTLIARGRAGRGREREIKRERGSERGTTGCETERHSTCTARKQILERIKKEKKECTYQPITTQRQSGPLFITSQESKQSEMAIDKNFIAWPAPQLQCERETWAVLLVARIAQESGRFSLVMTPTGVMLVNFTSVKKWYLVVPIIGFLDKTPQCLRWAYAPLRLSIVSWFATQVQVEQITARCFVFPTHVLPLEWKGTGNLMLCFRFLETKPYCVPTEKKCFGAFWSYYAAHTVFPTCSSTQSNWGERFFSSFCLPPHPLSEGEAKKRGQIKGCPTPHAWEMSLAFKMLQVWQMLTATKWLITGTEKKSWSKAITLALA